MKNIIKLLLCFLAFLPFQAKAQNSCGTNDCCYQSDYCCQEYYVSLWGGVNKPFVHSKNLDKGWFVGGAVGTYLCPNIRFDISYDFLQNSVSHYDDVNKNVILLNGYYDFCPCGCFVPYVGGGFGYNYFNSDALSHHHSSIAFQFGGGVKYSMSECWSAALSYRLLGTTYHGTGYRNLIGITIFRNFWM